VDTYSSAPYPEKPKRRQQVPEGGYALRWLAVRWTFGFVLGWYVLMPLTMGFITAAFAGIDFENRILGNLILGLVLGVGGAVAGWVTWRLALVGRVPRRDWILTTVAAAVLGFGALGVVIVSLPPLYSVQTFDSGTRSVYTLNDGFITKEILMSVALVWGIMLPHVVTLWRYTRRAWLILPLMGVATAYVAWVRIGQDMWLAGNSDGVGFGDFSPYLLPVLAFVLVIPVLSGLILTFIGWKAPRKAHPDLN
jgi:hypothetical protein